MSNVFAGIAETERDDARPDNKYITDGSYAVELTKFMTRTSTNPKNKGQDMVIVEGSVLEVIDQVEGKSLRAGQTWVSIYMLERDRTDGLTPKGSKNMGRVKALVAQALGGVPDEVITAEMCGTLTEGDGDSLAGTRLLVTAETIHFEGGGEWTKLVWDAMPPAEEVAAAAK